MIKEVNILDFIAPEFRGKDPIDYEFRDDGKIVRKDRWMNGMNTIAQVTGMFTREGYEIPDVVARVEQVFAAMENIHHPYILDVLERVAVHIDQGSSNDVFNKLRHDIEDSIVIVRTTSEALAEKEGYEPNPT